MRVPLKGSQLATAQGNPYQLLEGPWLKMTGLDQIFAFLRKEKPVALKGHLAG